MTLTEFLGELERRAAQAEAVGSTAPLASVYRSLLAEIRPLLVMEDGKSEPSPAPAQPDRLLDVEEAAALLGVASGWLYRHARTLPFTRRLGRKVLRFSEAGLRRWIENRPRKS